MLTCHKEEGGKRAPTPQTNRSVISGSTEQAQSDIYIPIVRNRLPHPCRWGRAPSVERGQDIKLAPMPSPRLRPERGARREGVTNTTTRQRHSVHTRALVLAQRHTRCSCNPPPPPGTYCTAANAGKSPCPRIRIKAWLRGTIPGPQTHVRQRQRHAHQQVQPGHVRQWPGSSWLTTTVQRTRNARGRAHASRRPDIAERSPARRTTTHSAGPPGEREVGSHAPAKLIAHLRVNRTGPERYTHTHRSGPSSTGLHALACGKRAPRTAGVGEGAKPNKQSSGLPRPVRIPGPSGAHPGVDIHIYNNRARHYAHIRTLAPVQRHTRSRCRPPPPPGKAGAYRQMQAKAHADAY